MPQVTEVLKFLVTGQVAIASASATQLPNVDAKIITLKAHPDNTSTIAFGGDNGVTVDNGYVLEAGQESPAILLGNLSQIFARAAVNGEVLIYQVQR